MRTTRTRLRLVSTCAPWNSKSARCARSKVSSRSTRPSRPTSFRAHNHELKRATGVRDTSSNAGRRARVLTLVPAGSAPLRAPGRLHWLSDASVGGPLAACARDGGSTSSDVGRTVGPPGLSNAPRARRPAPQSQPLRGEVFDAANSNVSRPASGAHSPRLHQGRVGRPRGPGHDATPEDRPPRAVGCARRAL